MNILVISIFFMTKILIKKVKGGKNYFGILPHALGQNIMVDGVFGKKRGIYLKTD
jgi:hypothetical protein